MKRHSLLIGIVPVLTGLILAYGISEFVRADSMSSSSSTSIDQSACVTTTTNSLCERVAGVATSTTALRATVNALAEVASSAAPVANSYLDRILTVAPVVISTVSPLSVGPHLAALGATQAGGASAFNFGANRAILIPFRTVRAMTIVTMAIENGGTVSGNIDMGIYDASFARLVSLGSTAQGAINTFQLGNITDQALAANTLYYMAFSMNNATGLVTSMVIASGAQIQTARFAGAQMGLFSAATSFPLPANITVDTGYASLGVPLVIMTTSTSS